MSGIEIIGTGSYVPEFIADNNKFSEFLDTSDEWITPRTGIKQRHILTDKPNYYMGTEAAKKAIEDADDMMYRNKHADSRAAKSSVS